MLRSVNTFAFKHQFQISTLKNGFLINSVGAGTKTKHIVWSVPINIGEKRFSAHLIVLLDLGLDVILGMNWTKEHEVTIDTTNRVL
jgi:hypothetical protein